jgi:catechol 2,3-dioxygenase-like lactoylglutathione lyase family enzyme
MPTITVIAAVPVLHCADVDAALAFYSGMLGATVSWRDRVGNPSYTSIRWRGCELHLSSHAEDGVAGAAVFFRIADVDALFAELLARGFAPPGDLGPVFASPTDQTWGMREFYVRDPDGNSLRFAASIGR